ncbi:amidohydrolase family protein [Caulobacter segnis]
MRFMPFVPCSDWEKMAAIVAKEGRGDDWVRWGAMKALADGSLGSRTAVFHDHYDDAPDQTGVRVTTLANLREWITAADAHGLHASSPPTPSATRPMTTCWISTRRSRRQTGSRTAVSASSTPSI